MAEPIPEGYHAVTPYLAVKNAAEAIDWYKQALGASEVLRFEHDGKVGHAEIRLGDSIIMLADESPASGHVSPQSLGGTGVSLHVYVEDIDGAFQRAIDSGATVERAVQDQFYGDRSGSFRDPFGHRWHFATHVEDVGEAELDRRMQEFKPKRDQREPA